MSLRHDKGGFVLSGIALLLIIPAMLLMASTLMVVETGGQSTNIQGQYDKVYHTGEDLSNVINLMQNNNVWLDDNILKSLTDNCRSATGLLVDVHVVSWVFPIWEHIEDSGENHYAGSIYSWIEKISDNIWDYSFEDLTLGKDNIVDFDYNEPVLQVERVSPGTLKITALMYQGGYHSDIYYSNTFIFRVGNMTDNIGSFKFVSENQLQRRVISISVWDPRGAARYDENINLP
jgi:hypothetical protein